MRLFLLVCLGGAAGSGARYLVALWAAERLGRGFPWGTLGVNVLGSFLMGLIMARGLPEPVRVPVATGVLGGFTTYSAFNHEIAKALEEGLWTRALLYAAATLAGCLGAGFAGTLLGRSISTD